MIEIVKYVQKVKSDILIFLILTTLLSDSNAVYWSSSISTNSSSWDIYRQSNNISFDLSSSVIGNVAPIRFHGMLLRPYNSYYAEVKANEVRFRERTSALDGNYRSEDMMRLRSNIKDKINIEVLKPEGSRVLAISYYEQWPVSLMASRTLEYSGKQINDRDFEGNNRDFLGTNFLYNSEYSKEYSLNLSLERMNITVLATDEDIEQVDTKATKSLDFRLKAHTTGIADISYRQLGTIMIPGSIPRYQVLNEGQERFVGDYQITKKINMGSRFDHYVTDDTDWLPCCYGGWGSMEHYDRNGFGISARQIFDCSCNKALVNTHFLK